MGALSLGDLVASIRITRELIRIVHRPLTVEGAKTLIRSRLARRDQVFLEMVDKAIWPYAASPYRRLLQWAGWSPDRLAASVAQSGLDATLRILMDAGVYMTYEEFKGRKPIERPGLMLECSEQDTDNPGVVPSFEVQTGGTRSQGSRIPATLDSWAVQRMPAWFLALEALNAGAWPVIIWLPRDAGLLSWLMLVHAGRPAVRWFSLTDLSAYRTPALHRAMYAATQVIGLTRGLRIPSIEHVPLAKVEKVLDTVLETRASRGMCAVLTTPSAATRLAGLVNQRGIKFDRVTFTVGGEPLTPGKHQEIIRSGARVGARYALTELGAVGGPCGRPEVCDDVHFFDDCFGLVRDRRVLADGQVVEALVMTTLLPSSTKILLNVETDDFAEVTERRCGCLWDELGLRTHFHSIRSFSKLTGESASVLGTVCVRILEEVLPREFGGQSTDYQLLEAEDEHHLTRLYLVVSPSVGPIDEERLRARFIEELRDPTRPRHLVPPLWRQADTIQVVRREPVATARGKLLPFHTLATTFERQRHKTI